MSQGDQAERIQAAALRYIQQMTAEGIAPSERSAVATAMIATMLASDATSELHLHAGVTLICDHLWMLAEHAYRIVKATP